MIRRRPHSTSRVDAAAVDAKTPLMALMQTGHHGGRDLRRARQSDGKYSKLKI